MLPVAIVLLVLILVFVVGAVISNPEPVTLDVFVAQVPTSLAVVFIVGMVSALALAAALALLWFGLRRQRARAKAARSDRGTRPAATGRGADKEITATKKGRTDNKPGPAEPARTDKNRTDKNRTDGTADDS